MLLGTPSLPPGPPAPPGPPGPPPGPPGGPDCEKRKGLLRDVKEEKREEKVLGVKELD